MINSEKLAAYERCRVRIEGLCEGERDEVALMASVVGVLHNEMPGFYWTGFYRMCEEGGLVVGPYQGTIGCLRIAMGRGVCGTAAETGVTQVVEDVHEFPGHIACDAKSRSEIVVPLKDAFGAVRAVLDVDSTEVGTFDEVDQVALEEILAVVFGKV